MIAFILPLIMPIGKFDAKVLHLSTKAIVSLCVKACEDMDIEFDDENQAKTIITVVGEKLEINGKPYTIDFELTILKSAYGSGHICEADGLPDLEVFTDEVSITDVVVWNEKANVVHINNNFREAEKILTKLI